MSKDPNVDLININPYMQSRAQICEKLTSNNLILDLVNINTHTKFSKILSIGPQVIKRKRNSYINQEP